MRESELDQAFAEALGESPAFQAWMLSGGRFSRHAATARLLHHEQASSRKAKHWWKHWWCTLPDGSQSETDIFLVFESQNEGRFSLHIENKMQKGILTLSQSIKYRQRAAFKANDSRWLGYNDFEVILIAPNDFLQMHKECLCQFDRGISYEEISAFVPLFGAISRSQNSNA
ncbi:hypothetical protein [uncultured Methylobacterium sp.]|jgi:hypothetical protein|uniref:hypothetical protein n=1 Tax=uncultured Methylobacterium sp. TaxID=157278 RepID=UPI0026300228|nr:hypothetical protein [uncultured Methylobacterium sp.]